MGDPSLSLDATGDVATVERMLAATALPTRDLRSSDATFYLARVDGERVGVGGLEVYGHDALVRSVVVAADARGNGYGRALVAALEDEARSQGIERAYLLTTTAADFFADCGYETIPRAEVPEAIRETTEFEDLCPASATCMQKSL
jgi:amino-acid N-acetyltransferase